MRKEVGKKITNILVTGHEVAKLYDSYSHPTEGPKYKSFVYDVLKILSDINDHHFEGFAQWLFENEGNNLPTSSSGSLFTALRDQDNFLSGCGGDELDDEEFEFFDNLFNALFN